MLSRREFIKLCMSAALAGGVTKLIMPFVREAYAQGEFQRPPAIWMDLGSCTGESVSLENAVNPDVGRFMQDYIDLRAHLNFSAAQGEEFAKAILDTVKGETGKYWLIIEGAVMTADDGHYDEKFLYNGRVYTGLSVVREFAPKAKYVIAVGNCACYGGPSATYPNQGGAKGVWDIVGRRVINVSGCPSHYDWMIGTLIHLLFYGIPELDTYNRPKAFFGKTIHDLCQRRQQFEDGIFAAFPGQSGCLYKVGCKGPVTHADCPTRQWNHAVNWPVKAGTPCIGCANPAFSDGMMPFYSHLPEIAVGGKRLNIKKLGTLMAGLGIAGVATHWTAAVAAKRIHKHYLDGTQPIEPAPPQNPEQLKQELDDLIRKQKTLIAQADKLAKRQGKRRKTIKDRIFRFWIKDQEDDT